MTHSLDRQPPPESGAAGEDARLAAIVRSSHDAIVGKTLEGVVTSWNEAAERLYGYTAGQIIGRRAEILYPEARRREETEILRRISRGERIDGYVTDRIRRDGSSVTVSLSVSPIAGDGGRIIGAAAISRDAGRPPRIEAVRFLALVSHELRTPLHAILGFTGTLLMGLPGPLNEEQTRQLRLVETGGQHLLSLVDDLLDLSRIESGKVEITPETFGYRSVVREVVESMRPLAARRGLTLTAHLPEQECLGVADRRLLRQILVNLVDNAIKYTPEGQVRVELYPAPAEGKWPEGKWPEGKWIVQVSDTGPGIAPAEQARIFGAFERGAGARKRGGEGTGLGLYISHRLAELMGYHLELRSVPGEGSTFCLAPAG